MTKKKVRVVLSPAGERMRQAPDGADLVDILILEVTARAQTACEQEIITWVVQLIAKYGTPGDALVAVKTGEVF